MRIPKRWPVAVAFVMGVTVLGVMLLRAPLYPRYSAEECRAAYSRARTQADTNRVDLHPFDPARREAMHYCVEARNAAPTAVGFVVQR